MDLLSPEAIADTHTRALGRARTTMGLIAVLVVWLVDYETVLALQVLATAGLLTLAGVGIAQTSGRMDGPRAVRTGRDVTLACIVLTMPVAPHADVLYVGFVLTLLVSLEALRGGRPAVLVALTVGTGAEVVRAIASQVVEGHVHPLDGLLGLGLAATVGLAAAAIHEEREAGRLALAEAAGRSRRDEERTRDVLRQLEHIHTVVDMAIGRGGDVDSGLAEVVRAVQTQFGLHMAGVVMIGDDGRARTRASTTPTVHPTDGIVPVLTPGPLARALSSGGVHHATAEERARIRHRWPGRRDATCAALRGRTGIIGALVLDHGPTSARIDDQFLLRLADLLVLVVTAGEAVRREAALAEASRAMEQMKTDFIAVASHELRTPLTAMRGSLETLHARDDLLDDEQRGLLLEVSLRQTRRLTRLVDDLRTVSAVDAGELAVSRAPFELDAAIGNAVATLTGALPGFDVQLRTGPPTTVDGDDERFQQVLENLVRNAHDHGADRAVVTWEPSGDKVEVTVADDGPGVPPALANSIFDRFVRGGTTDRHSRGIGLGLAIARELVEEMGGSLVLDANTDGARFRITLPLARVTTAT